METENRRKPWDTSAHGQHPALCDLTPTEAEIQSLANSIGRVRMTDAQKFLDQAMRDCEVANANMRLFESDGQKAKAITYRKDFARALCKLGRFNEAIEMASRRNKIRQGFAKIVKEIRAIQTAVERDDDEECGCERQKSTIPINVKNEATIILNRRYAWGEVYSEKHKEIVTMWICSICGDANAHPNVPERQRIVHEARQAVAHIKSAKDEIPAHLSDKELLKG